MEQELAAWGCQIEGALSEHDGLSGCPQILHDKFAMQSLQQLIEALNGGVRVPASGFISYKGGALAVDEVAQISAALKRTSGQITGLRLQSCGIGDMHIRALLEGLATASIQILELPDNSIGRDGATLIRDALESSNYNLEALDLTGAHKASMRSGPKNHIRWCMHV